ncbi:MAG: FdhF/YdeP family oxidoreductase [Bacteroidia bacterium]|nr:FdhF/YdeP family oxidoreductase [Bacteroidia bacterium]
MVQIPDIRKVKSVIPETLHNLKIRKPAEFAAGIKGVTVALEHAIQEMGTKRALETLARLNQKDGFDCPGCAWPDPDDKRSLFAEYCENGVKAVAEEATRQKVGPDFFKEHSISEMMSWSDYKIGKSGRLTHPMILREGEDHYSEISWQEAFDQIGSELNNLNHPNEAIFYTSGRSSNEAAFLWGLFARAFGTNNLPDCSNMCHESSGVALSQTLGIGKGSVTLDDLPKAEVVIVTGQNPGTNHPRMLTALQQCKLNGGKIITINPLEEAGLKRFKNPQRAVDYFTSGTTITDLFLQVKINGDVALLKAIMKVLTELSKVDRTILDHEFIQANTSGFAELQKDLQQESLSSLAERSGISIVQIKKAANLIAHKKKIIICWAMGLTQHHNGVDNIKSCVNLLLLKGAIGKEGAGTCPVRGHSNVQGDRSVGIMHHVSPQLNNSIKDVMGFDPPSEPGLDTVASIKAMHEGQAKIFIALGGNFLTAASDTAYTAKALSRCKLTVQISTKLNRSHLVPGNTALILPTLGRTEKDLNQGKERLVTVENSMGKVHKSKGHLTPASQLLMSEPEIVGQIANATLQDRYGIQWSYISKDYESIRNLISQIIKGFEHYNDRIEDSGFYLPNNARDGDFSKLSKGRAHFSVCPVPDHQLHDDEFLLMTIRSHDQYNTTIYGMDDRYRGIIGERRVILINQKDMAENNLSAKQLIDLSSTYDGQVRWARSFHIVPYNIPKGNLAGYFPELNCLVPIDEFALESRTPISKSVKVRIFASDQ